MSRGFDKNGLFVDTGYLRDHVSKLREEKKIAMELYEYVAAMKGQSDPEMAYRYNDILSDVEQLIEYFNKIGDALSHIDDEAVHLSHVLGSMIEDDAENTHHTASGTFVL